MQVDFRQLVTKRCTNARWELSGTASNRRPFMALTLQLHSGPPVGIGFNFALLIDVGIGRPLRFATFASTG